jgi:hypothetical protein
MENSVSQRNRRSADTIFSAALAYVCYPAGLDGLFLDFILIKYKAMSQQTVDK